MKKKGERELFNQRYLHARHEHRSIPIRRKSSDNISWNMQREVSRESINWISKFEFRRCRFSSTTSLLVSIQADVFCKEP